MSNVYKKIELLDLDPIIFSLVSKEDGVGWSIDKARNVSTWYRRFLFLMNEYPNAAIVPNKDIDTFWHQHILDTKKYFIDCDLIFGCYLHHFPYFGVRGMNDKQNLDNSFKKTNELYIQHFGEFPAQFNSSVCTSSCSQCTHCKSVTAQHDIEADFIRDSLAQEVR